MSPVQAFIASLDGLQET